MGLDQNIFTQAKVAKYYKELQGESHRATAIIGPTILDNILEIYLRNFFIKNRKSVNTLLSDPHSPLGTFNSRILTAYCLGLIGSKEHTELYLIRKIRNKFAHDLETLSFEDQSIQSYCSNLKYPKLLYKVVPEVISFAPRDLFIYSVSSLHLILLSRSSNIKDKREVPKDMFPTELEKPS